MNTTWCVKACRSSPAINIESFSREAGRLHLNAMCKVCYTYPVVLLWDINRESHRSDTQDLRLYRKVYAACYSRAVEKLLDSVAAGVMNGLVSLSSSHIRRITLAYIGSLPILLSPDY